MTMPALRGVITESAARRHDHGRDGRPAWSATARPRTRSGCRRWTNRPPSTSCSPRSASTRNAGCARSGWGGNGRLIVPIAIVDKPFEQRRDLLWADLSGAAGHAIVVGAPQSGKSTLLRTLLCVDRGHPHPRRSPVLPAGHGRRRARFDRGPAARLRLRHPARPNRARRVVAEAVTLLAQREQFFATNGIDSAAAFRQRRAELRESGEEGREFGDVFVVVDDWTTLRHEYEQLDEAITNLAARGLGFGIHVIVSANSWMGVRAPLRDAIGTRFELRLGDPADSSIDRRAAMNVPADAPGRGLTREKLHFLTALPRIDGNQQPATMGDGTQDLVKRIREGWTGAPAPAVRLLPGQRPTVRNRQRTAADPAVDPDRHRRTRPQTGLPRLRHRSALHRLRRRGIRQVRAAAHHRHRHHAPLHRAGERHHRGRLPAWPARRGHRRSPARLRGRRTRPGRTGRTGRRRHADPVARIRT